MSKNYLNLLESACKNFRKSREEIIDMVLYGSAAKGKEDARDIDIIVIFSGKSLKERQNLIQLLKAQLKKSVENIDVKSINIEELFDSTFLARQNIMIEGISLLDKMPLAEKLGFRGYAIFTYSLKNFTHNKKTKFNYALNGRASLGVLKSLEGSALGRAAVQIPIKNSYEFEEFLQKWNVNYKMKHALVPFY